MENAKFTKNEYNNYNGLFSNNAKFKSPEEEFEYNQTQYKECNKCNKTFCLNYYRNNTSGKYPFNKNGYRLKRGECIDCNIIIQKGKTHAKKIAKINGIERKAPYGTLCEICKSPDNIVFDHNHIKNVFRGWLCNGCNRSIGMLGESIEGLVKAINYMNKDENKIFVQDDNGFIRII